MMETVASQSTTITTVLVFAMLLPTGVLLTRSLGRRMGDYRRARLAEVNGVLRGLATAMGGSFQDGPSLAHHRLLGDLHEYGVARLSRGPLAIEVGVSYPADDLRDNRTTVRIRRPSDRRWLIAGLHQRRRPVPATGARTVDGEVASRFEVVGAGPLPPAAREVLLQVGARAFSLELRDDWIELIAPPDGDTVYIADIPRLRSLVEQLVAISEQLLAPTAA